MSDETAAEGEGPRSISTAEEVPIGEAHAELFETIRPVRQRGPGRLAESAPE